MRRGFTLVELLLALGLFSVLMLALVRLVDTSFTIWDDAERGRELDVAGARLLDQLSSDLRALEPGSAGDLVCAWEARDLDGDGIGGLFAPRLALVRTRGPAQAARAQRVPGAPAVGPRAGVTERIEVLWWLARERPGGAGAALLRAERTLDAQRSASLVPLASAEGDPGRAALDGEELAAGVLWLSFRFAAPTTVLVDGWRLGDELQAASASWDAWARGRPDAERSGFNDPAPGIVGSIGGPAALPWLPRRVQIELELERERDLSRRTRLAAALEPGESELLVADGRHLPPPGAFLRIDEEWVELVSVRGERASVRRARRGSGERAHEAGARVHFGRRFVKEVPLSGVREEWLR